MMKNPGRLFLSLSALMATALGTTAVHAPLDREPSSAIDLGPASAIAAEATSQKAVDWTLPAGTPHFRLLEPASWIIENDRGDPQKAGPCGGSNSDWGTPSHVINEATGGSLLHLAVEETIYHPGHYRVALAVNSMLELPPDPETETRQGPRGPVSVSAVIEEDPQPPILVDGLWEHYERPAPGENVFEADVRLPNIDCEECTLQVIQWMAEHGYNNPGGFTYHHCAKIRITADPSMPRDEGWPEQM